MLVGQNTSAVFHSGHSRPQCLGKKKKTSGKQWAVLSTRQVGSSLVGIRIGRSAKFQGSPPKEGACGPKIKARAVKNGPDRSDKRRQYIQTIKSRRVVVVFFPNHTTKMQKYKNEIVRRWWGGKGPRDVRKMEEQGSAQKRRSRCSG